MTAQDQPHDVPDEDLAPLIRSHERYARQFRVTSPAAREYGELQQILDELARQIRVRGGMAAHQRNLRPWTPHAAHRSTCIATPMNPATLPRAQRPSGPAVHYVDPRQARDRKRYGRSNDMSGSKQEGPHDATNQIDPRGAAKKARSNDAERKGKKSGKAARKRAAVRGQRLERFGIASVLLGVGAVVGAIAGSVVLRDEH